MSYDYDVSSQLLKSDPYSILAVHKEKATREQILDHKILYALCKKIYHFPEFNTLLLRLKKPVTIETLKKLRKIHHFKEVFPDFTCTAIGSGTIEIPISNLYSKCADPEVVTKAAAINISIGLKLSKKIPQDEYLTAKRIWRKSLTPIVRFAQTHNKLIVFASGNYGATNDDQYLPDNSDVDDTVAWKENTIIVGAIDNNFKVARFSDRGRIVEIYAPGVDIPVPGGISHGEIVAYLMNQITHFNAIHGEKIPDESSISKWELRSGTSFAAPFVTGAIQFIRSCIKNEYNKAQLVKELIISNARISHEGYPVLNFGLIIEDMKKKELLDD